MNKIDKTYKYCDIDYTQVEILSKELGISSITAKVLINRGFDTVKKASNFLNTDIDALNNPFLFKDMYVATERIMKAIGTGEKICIYGDYDADGITSISVLSLFLKKLDVDFFYYIPNRLKEGYGLNIEAIEKIRVKGAKLLITVDCGITNIMEVDNLVKSGIDVIITDHHQCGNILPDALAIINPNRINDDYPFNGLAGVGVAFKLVEALANTLGISIDYDEILPIVALGTVADVMPLVGENRIIVKNGLKLMESSNNNGIRALLEITGLIGKCLSAYHMGFVLGPRLNAAGRLGDPTTGVSLFVGKDYETALEIAKKLDMENVTRQEIEDDILNDIENLIKTEVDLDKDNVIVLSSDRWHSGIIGICASKVVEKYHKPTILFSIEDDLAKGSARSIPTFDLYDGLSKCGDIFEKFGGHRQAAGILIKEKNIEEFKERINAVVDEVLVEEDFIEEVQIDCKVNPEDVTIETIEELNELEPFGMGNPTPKFAFTNGIINEIRQIGKDNRHLKLQLSKNNMLIDGIGFNFGQYGNILSNGDTINVLVNLNINEYMGNVNPQMIVKEIMGIRKDKVDVDRGYYTALSRYVYGGKLIGNNETTKYEITTTDNRESYTIDKLKTKENVLVLIYNYNNLNNFIYRIQMEGRDILKRVSISYNNCETRKTNTVIALPLYSKLRLSNYDEIIVYDMSFYKNDIGFIIENAEIGNTEFLMQNDDIKKNREILSQVIPTIEEMRIIYKSLYLSNEVIFKLEPNIYLSSINSSFNGYITIPKLDITLNIFKDIEFIDYVYKDDFFYIKILNRSKKKFNMNNNLKYKYLNDLNSYYSRLK